jgi:hypothetical protein
MQEMTEIKLLVYNHLIENWKHIMSDSKNYIDNGNDTITDLTMKLIWKKKRLISGYEKMAKLV